MSEQGQEPRWVAELRHIGVNPDLIGAENADVVIAAYDIHDASVFAAVEVIVGAREAQGELPVQLSTED